MTTITYHPIDSDLETSEHETLGHWFVDQFGPSVDIPFKIAITHDDVNKECDITAEIKAGDPHGHLTSIEGVYHVLEIPEGGVVDSIKDVVAFVFPVAALGTFLAGAAFKAAIPKPDIPALPGLKNRRQESSTNSLGNRENTARPGERYQDVRGFEPAVYADLLMEPHRRYEDNKETEYIYGTVSTGKVDVTNPRDGVTPFENIDEAQLNIYWPGTSPNTGDDPVLEINGKIEYPVVASFRNRNVNGQELIPPNQEDYAPVGPFRLLEGVTKAWLNLLAQAGIYKAGANDETYSVTLEFTLFEISAAGDRTGNSTVLPAVTMVSNPVNINDQVGLTVDFDVPYAICEIEGRRTSNTDKNFEGTVLDEVKWAAVYEIEPVDFVAPEGVTTSYAKILQTPAALAAQERKLNFGVKRYERRYLGNGQMSPDADTPSDEFADAVVGLALDPYVGKNIELAQLNVDSLYAVQEEVAAYFGTREAVKFGYSFSTTGITFEDHLTLIGNAVFCRVFRIGNTYEFKFDRPRSRGETALLLNHRMKYQGTDKRSRKFTDVESKNYDGVIVTYKDLNSKVFENINIPEGTLPTNPLEVELSGVVYKQVATWKAMREWNKIQYRRVFHQTEAHSSARGLLPGDRIIMANDTLTKSLNGQVLEQSGLDLRLADGIELVDGQVYDISLLYKTGYVENILCQKSDLGPYWVRLFALPAEPLYTGNLQWRTTYNLYPSTDSTRDDMLVETMTVDIKNGQERVNVQAVNYDVRYWDGDPKEVSTGSFSTAFNDSFDKGQTGV